MHTLDFQAAWSGSSHRNSKGRFGGWGILSEGERGHEHQSYVMLLMQMLADGEPLPALSDVLEKTVRDPTWNQGVVIDPPVGDLVAHRRRKRAAANRGPRLPAAPRDERPLLGTTFFPRSWRSRPH